jgi:hypothetical protein
MECGVNKHSLGDLWGNRMQRDVEKLNYKLHTGDKNDKS